jgi:hypothetical protein
MIYWKKLNKRKMTIERAKQMFLEGYITCTLWISFKDGRKSMSFYNLDVYTARKMRSRYIIDAKEFRIYHSDYKVPLIVQRN